ncbi:hypothetical protein GL279_18930 [Paracoccus limosus]|uniref:Uncharacterized protein n=1 Tax=Paracoccus limosus TaxID=913252 RepID=A0A844HBH7_9RHOB|nr:hypothetical protein [Paracoccus limosus]MTH36648.1 hypothetical protein [Paracoccus limosus]
MRALAATLGIFTVAVLILATCLAVALGALLAQQTAWAWLWGIMTDFAAPTAAQARAEGWQAIAEKV